jgi:hypothetical protein
MLSISRRRSERPLPGQIRLLAQNATSGWNEDNLNGGTVLVTTVTEGSGSGGKAARAKKAPEKKARK